jgi:predicted metal-dependent enzyme (double-stranded beta helix superfamily)
MESLRKIIDTIDYKDQISFSNEKYTKIVLEQNEKYEVYLICWRNGQTTNIHDHPEGGCLMKLVSGTLLEENYRANGEFLYPRTYIPNMYAFKCGKNVVHRITAMEESISLHVYFPPNYNATIYEFS